MSTARRGIRDHEVMEMVEVVYKRLRSFGIDGPMADRAMVGLVSRACMFSALEAIEAANRLVPPHATEPAVGLESPATTGTETTRIT